MLQINTVNLVIS